MAACAASGLLMDKVRPDAAGLFLVAESEGAPVTGVFTLHDLMRAQAALSE